MPDHSDSSRPAAACLWLRVVNIASLVSFVCILGALWIWIPYWEHMERSRGLLLTIPFWLPYGFILLRLQGERIKTGLTLAVAMGCMLFVPGILLICFVYEWDRNWWILGTLTLASLMQLVLMVAAIVAYRSIPHARRDWLKLLGSLSYGFVVFGLFLMAYSPVPEHITINESGAVGFLRAATSAASIYTAKSQGLYPMSFAGWGPSSKPECIAKDAFAIPVSNPHYGYSFEYRGVSPVVVRGCTLYKSYTMTARPVIFHQTGVRSFFADQSRFIHFTSENRPATANDPLELGFSRSLP